MRVFVAGGTGVIGRSRIPALTAAGHQVTATTRAPAWAGRLLAGDSVLSLMTRIRGSSNARARREFGWTPRYASWRSGFATGLVDDHDAERDQSGARTGGGA